MPIFLISTLSTFRMKYAIEAETLEHAYDELVMTEHSRDFDEVTQRWLGEQIVDAQVVTEDQLRSIIEECSQDNNESCSHWMGDKLIHKVIYENSVSK